MTNGEEFPEVEEEDSDFENIEILPPKMSIHVRSSVPLEVTVTNTCLEVLNNLVKVGNNLSFMVHWKLKSWFELTWKFDFNINSKYLGPELLH